jgi:hypothetical protein
MLQKLARWWLARAGLTAVQPSPTVFFRSDHYVRHNARRLEHLASLRLPVANRTVLEVGAGVGDHSHYYLDRACKVTITEGRTESVRILKSRYPGADVRWLDLDSAECDMDRTFEVVHCYGLLYHLRRPEAALDFMARHCEGMVLLETCVSFGDDDRVHPVSEDPSDPTQAVSGTGCRPTRRWVFERLKQSFPFVYVPLTQPNHEEFPLDWTSPEAHTRTLSRSVFIASRRHIDSSLLSPTLLDRQERHE